MNIMICGRCSGIGEQLAYRLGREKHEIYHISGNKRDESLGKEIFQEYHFPYLSNNINYIMESAKPDVMIILGAFDTNYNWRKPNSTANDYITGLTGLLMAAGNAGVEKIIYLSSVEIYEKNTEKYITSETTPEAESLKMNILLKAEKLVSDFEAESGVRTVILRMPPEFGDISENNSCICQHFAEDYLKQGKIVNGGQVRRRAIFFKDAVEAVIRVLHASDRRKLYQIGGLLFTQQELTEVLISGKWNDKAVIEDLNIENEDDYPPEFLRETDEPALNLEYKYSLEAGMKFQCRELLRNREIPEEKKERRLNILPIIESVAMAVVAFLLTVWLKDTFVGNGLNIFLLYVLILASVYGMSHGLLASLLGGVGLLAVMVRGSSFLQIIGGHEYYLGFLQLILVAVIAGYMRDKYKRKNNNLTEEKNYLESELSDINRINDNTAYIKDVYEKRILGYENSLARIYESTSQLDFMESHKVTFQAVRTICELLDVKDVAIYTASRRSSYLRLAAASTPLAATCGKSLKFDENTFAWNELSKREVYSNRKMEAGKPAFASAVYYNDKIINIIMVWTDDIRKINLYTGNTLAVAGRLIEKSMARAFLYEEAQRNNTYVENTPIMKADAFYRILEVYQDGKAQGLLDYAILKLEPMGKPMEKVVSLVRETDSVGIVGRELYAILSNTDSNEAMFVVDRYADAGMRAELTEFDAVIGKFGSEVRS